MWHGPEQLTSQPLQRVTHAKDAVKLQTSGQEAAHWLRLQHIDQHERATHDETQVMTTGLHFEEVPVQTHLEPSHKTLNVQEQEGQTAHQDLRQDQQHHQIQDRELLRPKPLA